MFNDYNGPISPDKLNDYINGFSFMTNEQLSEFISLNELSFTLEQMIYIRDYFKNVKKMFPTYNQLLFFNEINKIRKLQKKEFSIYSATATNGAEAILETSKDLLTKRKVIKRTVLGAMPISFAAEIASEYLAYIDFCEGKRLFSPAKSSELAQYYIHTDDNIPLFTYTNFSQMQTQAQNAHNTLVMLCPTVEMDYAQYCERVKEFTALSEINSIISNVRLIRAPYGIFDVLIQENEGVLVNLSSIPEIEKDEAGKVIDLRATLFACIGRYIFSTSNISIGIINQRAEEYSLKASIFGIKNQSHIFTFESIKNPAFSFDFNFLQSIINFKEHREYIFTDERNYDFGAKKNVYLTDTSNSDHRTYRAEKILRFGDILTTAAARDMGCSPHKSAALTVIDAINTLIAKGVAKNDIALSINYSLFTGTDDSEELGRNLATVLGAYRSMIELCVSDASPQLSYNRKSRDIVVLASAKAPIKQVKSTFANSDTYLYFYELKYQEDGLPDYKKYREFIKLFYSVIEYNILLSAFSINENLNATIQGASPSTSINFELDFDGNNFENSHGMLFETTNKLNLNSKYFKSKFSNIYGDIFYIGDTTEKY